VAGVVPIVKIQSACFERYRGDGLSLVFHLTAYAHQRGLLVIDDAKRGDIGASSAHYAAGEIAHQGDASWDAATPDALTVNSYLGGDGLQPFVDAAAEAGAGLFALVRTSNPGGDALQGLRLEDGRAVADAVAQMIAELGRSTPGLVGACGYSSLGAVVGATKPDDAARLRQLMPQQIFLVPGFGAQGGNADDVRACFDDTGRGALISASRSVLYAFEKRGGDWQQAVHDEAADMVQQVNDALGAKQ